MILTDGLKRGSNCSPGILSFGTCARYYGTCSTPDSQGSSVLVCSRLWVMIGTQNKLVVLFPLQQEENNPFINNLRNFGVWSKTL